MSLKHPRLYQMLTDIQLDKFLKGHEGKHLSEYPLTEIKDDLMYGDFIVCTGYKFKKVFSQWQCLETPTSKHEKSKIMFTKAPNDILKK